MKRKCALVLLAVGLLLPLGAVCYGLEGAPTPASEQETEKETPEKNPLTAALLAFAAALSVGLCAIATSYAQSRIGAAGCGALAEKPETGTTVILLVAIPETMVILGFVVAVVILFVS